eukprot:gene46852-60463_t
MVPLNRPKMEEIKLFETSKERKSLEDLADLYSIIRTTESLEAAYSRDAITPAEYAEACKRLISQFKTTEAALSTARELMSVFLYLESQRRFSMHRQITALKALSLQRLF